ncbi:DNA mismatch repair protein Mlh3 isoform X1 [Anguilla anguilla]|uniref:DNA mismatch repair protein Mlh3 isoform X1 n=1 Tax=Anguilla anguilla TaxID=7936 RepID=UPI0015A9C690|nr:DNA mismatch repair protein Mlh3 isoform X1 [Anguilla anguilla]
MIKCLSKEVQARLRSGIAIFSLQQCVEELVLNGIDAGATCIAVRLDMEAFKVQVIDNGSGIGREDMEHVGKRYFTSKCSSLEDLECLRFYGFRGEAVASIASLATLVEIASRSRLTGKTFVKIFRDGKGMDVFESESCRPSAGTTVVICNFFHNMPVRRKRVDVVLECERIRQRVEAVSLVHPSISFTLKNDCTGAMVVQLPKAKSTYFRFVQIHGMARAQKLSEISLKHSQFEMSGYIGREGHYNNSLQFLFVNGRLVLKTRIHKLLNFLLKKINASGRQNGNQGGSPAMGSPKQRAGAEVHGMYIINIKCHYSEYDICLEPAKTLIEFKDWDSVLSCVEEGVKEFLTRENLVAEISPEDVCSYVHDNYFTEPMTSTINEDNAAVHAIAPTLSITEELYNGNKLMSKAVHRMLEQDSDKAKSVHVDEEGNTMAEEEKKLRVTEIPRDRELTVEHVSLEVASISDSFDSEISERAINCDLVAGTSSQKSESLKCIIDDMVSNHNVQLENAVGTTDLGCSEIQCCANTKTVIRGEQQSRSPKKCEEKVDDIGVWHSKTHERKMNECCSVGKLQNTSLEKQRGEASDSGRTALRFGSVGFIKHLVPPLQNADVPKTSVPGTVCSLGPVSAQDLLPLKECHFRDYGSSTLGMVPSSHSKSLSTHKRDIYQTSVSSAFEAQENPLLAPKRKLSLSVESSVITSKASRIKPCPKLALSVQTGSLDRFRRMHGKQTGAQCHPLETAGCKTSLDAISSQTECTFVNAEKLSLCQYEKRDTSETLKTYSLQPSDCCVTLSEYTRLKPFTAQTRSSKGSLASKLSHLKENRVKDKRSALERPLGEASDFFSSLNSALTDTLMQDSFNTEEQTCTPLCSADDVALDMNANYQQSQMELHCDKSDSTKSAEFCKNAFTTTPNVPTPVLSVGDSIADSVQMATNHYPDVCSNEVVNSFEKDGPLCTDTTPEENEQSETSDWLELFDDSIGKLVYINKRTGLSKYEAPVVEETQVPCTTDVTTMSISVISRKGFEYTCYPFQSELVLPFLPRSRAERVLSSGLVHTDATEASNSLSSMFSEWSNPVFVRPPEVAVDVTSGQAEGLAVKIHNILFPYRFTKDMIHSMKVVHQVDKKFLACLINTRDMDAESGDSEGNLLVLVDQHAAHERVRLENLITESYEEDPETPGQKRLCSSSVTPPLEIEVTEEELRLLRSCQPFLRGLGLEIRFSETGDPQLLVGKVPMCFVEREANELRRGRHTATKAIVEEYIREQIELLRSTGRVRGTLPLTVLKVLASQACHGAVKFNHSLSMEECCSLVGSLSACQLPFQCAHGRPSMVPLADLLHLDNYQQESPKPNLRKLRRMYRAWELYGKK